MPSSNSMDSVSAWRAAVFVAFALFFGFLVWFIDEPLSRSLLSVAVLTFVFLGASAFKPVVTHPLYNLVSAVYTMLLFAGMYFGGAYNDVVLLVLTVLSTLGVGVEVYNYRHGTSYLRLDYS
nr:phosphatidate cytidylyltransferase [Haloferax larsenii]